MKMTARVPRIPKASTTSIIGLLAGAAEGQIQGDRQRHEDQSKQSVLDVEP